ncbi:hypothetical protein DL546_005503 [Coniochaeta pulveracea]|uniref:CENP-V/GFA domain-containing protein n=1 Tax=Coniochaeta pulveracea TaxID=177199 RepID=A0A420Y223_9PEZI|nr:hypothetical protein DL546_005503 [Coniochaeta pulveracea]
MFRRSFTVATRSLPRTLPLAYAPKVSQTPSLPARFLSTTARMVIDLRGRCVCSNLKYTVSLKSEEDARTTLCHCSSCRRAFGTNYGLTTKVPLEGFKYDQGEPKLYKQDNGVIREFCDNCGAYVCEYGEAAADKFRYVMWGTFDEPEKVPPKGEFFCSNKPSWMPDIPDVFRKQKIKE